MSGRRPRLWWGLAAMSVIVTLFGVTDIFAGLRADPAIAVGVIGLTPAELETQSAAGYRLADFLARGAGSVLLLVGVLWTAILAVPYRRRDRWAWAVMWTLPAWAATVPVAYMLVGVQADVPPPPPMVSGPIFAVLAAVLLVADWRGFAARAERRVPAGQAVVPAG